MHPILPSNDLIAKDANGKVMEVKNDGTNSHVALPSGKWETRIFSK
ncbi:MAG: hypothetical protein M3R50_03850 [Bacteroidota bacterium]|nr:hypothetical protein [Bacteroidota bacterium]